jgi:hypothetical protein
LVGQSLSFANQAVIARFTGLQGCSGQTFSQNGSGSIYAAVFGKGFYVVGRQRCIQQFKSQVFRKKSGRAGHRRAGNPKEKRLPDHFSREAVFLQKQSNSI